MYFGACWPSRRLAILVAYDRPHRSPVPAPGQKYAPGPYNINNLEPILGLFRGFADSAAPFIIQISKGFREYADQRMLEAMIRTGQGVTKINIDTDGCLFWPRVHREFFGGRPNSTSNLPAKLFVPEYAKFIATRMGGSVRRPD